MRKALLSALAVAPLVVTIACAPTAEQTGAGAAVPNASRPDLGAIRLTSDHAELAAGFEWAREQSLAYVFEGDPVGKWFEAALPGREAFCMRDVSHQIHGALALGLAEHTSNMLGKFAAAVADSRDWCGYWEIDRYDRPAPVDYRDDDDFWYNLPANFDVIDAAWRAYQWTGDRSYLDAPVFENFYRRSLKDYVARWDRDGDGLMESPDHNGNRGLASYYEGAGPRILTGADLVAAQYAANVAYANILTARGDVAEAASFTAEAERLRRSFNRDWWSEELGRFYAMIGEDGRFDPFDIPSAQIFPMYAGIVDPARADALFTSLAAGGNVEENSYVPEAAYRHGRDEHAFRSLLAQMEPGLPRREYPENPFTAVGTTVYWLAGIAPRASDGVVETRSRLPESVAWLQLDTVPVFGGSIDVHHVGRDETRLTNHTGRTLTWRVILAPADPSRTIVADPPGSVIDVIDEDGALVEHHVTLEVAPDETRVVRRQPGSPPPGR